MCSNCTGDYENPDATAWVEEVEPSEFLDKMTRLEIHRITLMEQERQAYVLVKAVEQTLLEANDRWERITAELNALGGEVN